MKTGFSGIMCLILLIQVTYHCLPSKDKDLFTIDAAQLTDPTDNFTYRLHQNYTTTILFTWNNPLSTDYIGASIVINQKKYAIGDASNTTSFNLSVDDASFPDNMPIEWYIEVQDSFFTNKSSARYFRIDIFATTTSVTTQTTTTQTSTTMTTTTTLYTAALKQVIGSSGSDTFRCLAVYSGGIYFGASSFTFDEDFSGESGFGSTDIIIGKVKWDGSLDTSFSGNGIMVIGSTGSDSVIDMVVFPDDSLAIVGYTPSATGSFAGETYNGGTYDSFIARIRSTGALDTAFSGNGVALFGTSGDDIVSDLSLTVDGKLMVLGAATATGGTFTDPFQGVQDFFMIKYNSNGTYDTTFSGDGRLLTGGSGNDWVKSLTQMPNGNYLVNVSSDSNNGIFASVTSNGIYDHRVVLFSSTGTIQTAFGSNGVINFGTTAADHGRKMLILPDGDILFAGAFRAGDGNAAGEAYMGSSNQDNTCLVRLNPDGTFDPSLDGNGIWVIGSTNSNNITDIELTQDGGVAISLYTGATDGIFSSEPAVGGYNQYVIKLDANLALDTSFSGNGILKITGDGYFFDSGFEILPNGHILLGLSTDSSTGDFAAFNKGTDYDLVFFDILLNGAF